MWPFGVWERPTVRLAHRWRPVSLDIYRVSRKSSTGESALGELVTQLANTQRSCRSRVRVPSPEVLFFAYIEILPLSLV